MQNKLAHSFSLHYSVALIQLCNWVDAKESSQVTEVEKFDMES